MPNELDEIRKLVQETKQQLETLDGKIEKIRRRLTVSALYGTMKFLIIVVPIAVSIFIFQPQIQTLVRSWNQALAALQAMQAKSPEEPSQPDEVRNRFPELFR